MSSLPTSMTHEAVVADSTAIASAASEGPPVSLAERVVWGLVLTPVAGSLGVVLWPILRLVIPGYVDPLVGSGTWNGWLLDAFVFAPIVGGVMAAPVTLLVLPIARGWLRGRDKISLLWLALIGLVGGLVSPPLIPAGLQSPIWFGMGAASGLIVAVLYFYLTDGPRRVVLRSAILGVLALYVVVPIGAAIWESVTALNPPPGNFTDVNLDDLIRTGRRPAAFKDVAIDPYGAVPIALYHHSNEIDWTPPFEATIKIPPRLLHDLFVLSMAPDRTAVVVGITMEALLPNLTLRTPENFAQFPADMRGKYVPHQLLDEDVLSASLSGIALPLLPDDWYRNRIRCNGPDLEPDPEFPGLSARPHNREAGTGIWIACQSEDLLPEGNNPVVTCDKDPYTHAFDERCMVEFVLPWQVYGPDMVALRAPRRYQENGHIGTRTSGSGIVANFSFPARRLAEWRRMRDLSLCLIEATVVPIRELAYPGRNAALCAEIKQAIAQRRDVLVGSSGPSGQ
jgi:hypothetical protein